MYPPSTHIPILYSDEFLLVINKPSGLPTLPDGYDAAAPHVRSLLEPLFGRVWIVHRLDRQTSGVLLLARTADAHRSLNTQFDQRKVVKIYHALVVGVPGWDTKIVELPLRTDVGHKHRTIVDPTQGKPAVTHLNILERFTACCLVEASPKTGRTHQIRAHLATLGFPLVGDDLYGTQVSGIPAVISRLGLHARQLTFEHPAQHKLVRMEAPYPDDFFRALDALRVVLASLS